MGIKASPEQIREWVEKGLIPPQDGPPPTVPTGGRKPPGPEPVSPAFELLGRCVQWVIPLELKPVTNNGALKRSLIGRAGKDRRETARHLARHLVAFSRFADAAQVGIPVLCRIVRLGGRAMDDDNLPVVAKWVRDTVALFMGVDDGPRGPVSWQYAQEPGGPVGVRIELVEM